MFLEEEEQLVPEVELCLFFETMHADEIVSSSWVDHCPPKEDLYLFSFGGLEAIEDAVG